MCNIECLKKCPFNELDEKVFYEIHITVTYSDSFLKVCDENNIKVVLIDMGEEVPNHLMTSHTYHGDNYKNEVQRLINIFTDNQFLIERVKVESTLNHKDAVNNSRNSYFESHFAIYGDIPDDLCKTLNIHKSRNLMKTKYSSVQMLTYRSYGSMEVHLTMVNHIKESIDKLISVKVTKVINEYCLEDTNIDMDDLWFRKKPH